jgi:hypothetical protein
MFKTNVDHNYNLKTHLREMSGVKQGKCSELHGFGHFDFENLNLFRISNFDIRNCRLKLERRPGI